ncbi:transient receptor potential cation channel subfamily A member 1 [Andrena cerasifolii]|uniref:transient receptor potential cation channel subfamily A member 1 n=1 Tax=Andrena cerasifolii TaxID=2819439 RepID=UPI0040378C5E
MTIVDPVEWPGDLTSNVNWKLLQACTLRHVPVAKVALSMGANVNCRRFDQLTPLHIATEHNDIDLIDLLCDQPSVDIEAKTADGLTPLHMAAFLGYADAIQKLVENGAMVNCVDNLGRYPLHYTAAGKNIQGTTVLLTSNANVNVYDVFDECPLYISVIRRPSFPMIKLLLSYGASVSAPPHHKSLGLILETVLFARGTPDIDVFDLLFQNEADLNATDLIGLRTPLHIAAMTGNLELATYLIQKRANLFRKNRAGYTPMETAIAYKNFEIVQLIEDWLSRESEVHEARSTTNSTNG